jgi:predicted nucleotide-binding protein
MFTSSKIANEYSWVGGGWLGEEPSLAEEIADLHESMDRDTRKLSSINERLELIPLAPGVARGQPVLSAGPSVGGAKVFLVHGHDEAVLEAVARFIGHLGLTPVILHEQASKGRTVMEKLEEHGDVGFAVVLLTPDDVGGCSDKELRPRARQNVVLELGYFLGRLERHNVCAIHRGELELPSDYMGVVYLRFDEGGGWRSGLAKELKAAGFSFDANKLLES